MESSKVRLFSTFSAEYKAIYVSHFSHKGFFFPFSSFRFYSYTRTVRPFCRVYNRMSRFQRESKDVREIRDARLTMKWLAKGVVEVPRQ